MEKDLKSKNFNQLSYNELRNTNGGGFGLFPLAFVGGVVYGYVKEKLESGK